MLETPQGIERRLVLRLLAHWRELCAGRRFPSFADIEPDAIADMWPHCFVLDLAGHEADPVFRYAGTACLADDQRSLDGMRVSEIRGQTLIAKSTAYFLEAANRRVPISRGGEFLKGDEIRVLYRSILLPMSDDGETLCGLFGAANCRETEIGAEPGDDASAGGRRELHDEVV